MATGELTALSTAKATTGESGPVGVAVSPDGKNLYVGYESEAVTKISQFEIQAGGELKALATQLVGAGEGPRTLVVSPDGKHVYVANFGGNTVSQYERKENGELKALGTPTIASGSSPHGITISHDGKNVYVSNYEGSTISCYSRNSETGQLTFLQTIAAGSKPNGVTISLDGKNVYVGNRGANTVSQYERKENGELKALGTPTVATGTTPLGVTVSPDGKNAYVPNSGSETVSQYERKENGELKALGTPTVATKKGPHGVVVSPDGLSAYCSDNESNVVGQYERKENGELKALGTATVAAGASPYGACVTPSGLFFYVADEESNAVSQYSRINSVELKATYESKSTLTEKLKSYIKFPSTKLESKSTLISQLRASVKLTPKYESKSSLIETLKSKIRFAYNYGIISIFSGKVEVSKSTSIHPAFSSVSSLSGQLKAWAKFTPKIGSKTTLSEAIRNNVKLLSAYEIKSTLSATIKTDIETIITPVFIISSSFTEKLYNYPKLSILYLSKSLFEVNVDYKGIFAEKSKILRTGPKVFLPSVEQNTHTPSVDWRWWLVRTSDLGQIAELNTAHSKQLHLVLNQPGTCTFQVSLLDDVSEFIQDHTTSILCYRNKKAIWSGPVFSTVENSTATADTLQVTAMGWYQLFNRRLLHTGAEFTNTSPEYPLGMVQKAIEEGRITSYTELGEEQSLELAYKNQKWSEIARDLITRANIDVETPVTVGSIPDTYSGNLSLRQFQKVGEQISKLTQLESSFDFLIDPLTRKFNMYYNEISGLVTGIGQNRGSGIKFTYPGNCVMAQRTQDGMKTTNRMETQGEYGVGKGENIESIQKNGLFEEEDSLPEVTNQNILIANANIEVEFLKNPFEIITFSPRGVSPEDTQISGVPRPFDDYEIGDIVYVTVERGPRFRIGVGVPQSVRVFGLQVEIDDNGREHITNIQTTKSGG